MNITPYVDSVRNGVRNAAALADESTRQIADRLGNVMDAATRLAIIDALCDAADTISADLAPASVVVRMAGSEPRFVVSIPDRGSEPTLLLSGADGEPEPDVDLDDEPVARISLRLPASVKSRVDEIADRDQISTNAWLLRAIMDALGTRRWPDAMPVPPEPPAPPGFGAIGPFPPGGPFGGSPQSDRHDHRKRGSVRGWVR